jgi:hypothetical protein
MILISLALTGCATQSSSHATGSGNVASEQRLASIYSPSPASEMQYSSGAALAFDPPVLEGTPRLDLTRDDRGTSAFEGFADSSTTFYYLRVDNRQGDLNGLEGYQRRAISETYGTSTR